ncbi:hypothetical protein PAXRUDRAFT_751857 [Paxillus rubicundulus Ve08.2h10]|uniref:Uncharacterized protein n=1 Tax=Paxillus rubicundulus Ve08.2h10 TaxID=930991 RepID=A0A0D0DIZ0_9AGAM|nr:hypothetical protein PAXRUDRAFT_751857 [Paxillus rubicundulus Ve08.2h10]
MFLCNFIGLCWVAAVSDADGVLGTATSIVDIILPSSSDRSVAFSSCRLAKPTNISVSSSESLFRRAPRLPRVFLRKGTHMNLPRDIKLVESSHKDAILLAVCASVGGAALVSIMIYVFVMCRRRKRGVIGGQDTLVRPFDTVVPAPTVTNTSMVSLGNARSRMGLSTPIPPRLNVDVSLPVLDISPRHNSGSTSGGYGNGTEKVFPQARKPSRSCTVPVPVSYSHSQPGAGTSRSTLRHHPSDLSIHSNPDQYASPYQSPDRSRAHAQSPTPTGSHIHLSQSNPSLPIRAQPPQPAEAPAPRSPSAQERRSAKRVLYISRSASDLYHTVSSVPRYRTPYNGIYTPSSPHAHHNYAHNSRIDTVTHPVNHLRHYYSASPVVHVPPGLDHHHAGHRDAGVMHEPPPPYHELGRLDEGMDR